MYLPYISTASPLHLPGARAAKELPPFETMVEALFAHASLAKVRVIGLGLGLGVWLGLGVRLGVRVRGMVKPSLTLTLTLRRSAPRS